MFSFRAVWGLFRGSFSAVPGEFLAQFEFSLMAIIVFIFVDNFNLYKFETFDSVNVEKQIALLHCYG